MSFTETKRSNDNTIEVNTKKTKIDLKDQLNLFSKLGDLDMVKASIEKGANVEDCNLLARKFVHHGVKRVSFTIF